MDYKSARNIIGLIALALTLVVSVPALAQVAEIQRMLNELSIDAGPVDGAAGPKTQEAWRVFLEHRGLPLDMPLNAAGLAEIRGQENALMPIVNGLKFEIASGRFSSRDTYKRDPSDKGAFSVTLRPGDYDPFDYRSGDYLETVPKFSLFKQRAEIVSQSLRGDRTYTVDFDFMAENSKAGTVFQIGRGEDAMQLVSYPDSLRLSAGDIVQHEAVYRGDWAGTWHSFRIVAYLAKDGASWFRTYVDGQQTLDTSGVNPFFSYPNGGVLHFGMYRGNATGIENTVHFRNMSLQEGDLGAPESRQ